MPDATVITVGVAKPSAHGQAITKTAIDNWIARVGNFQRYYQVNYAVCDDLYEFMMIMT